MKEEAKKRDESSDEEVEDDIDLDVQYGNIKEDKDVASKRQNDEVKPGFGYEDSVTTTTTQEPKDKTKKPTKNIVF